MSVPLFSGHWQAAVAPPLVPQVSPPVPQWVEACQRLQPLALSVTQVRTSVPEQEVAFKVGQPVPAVVPRAGQTQAPPAQVLEPPHPVLEVMTKQDGVLPSF